MWQNPPSFVWLYPYKGRCVVSRQLQNSCSQGNGFQTRAGGEDGFKKKIKLAEIEEGLWRVMKNRAETSLSHQRCSLGARGGQQQGQEIFISLSKKTQEL